MTCDNCDWSNAATYCPRCERSLCGMCREALLCAEGRCEKEQTSGLQAAVDAFPTREPKEILDHLIAEGLISSEPYYALLACISYAVVEHEKTMEPLGAICSRMLGANDHLN